MRGGGGDGVGGGSSLEASHPAAEEEAKPGGDGGVDGRSEEAEVESSSVVGVEEDAGTVGANGSGVVLVVAGAEEAVLAGVGHQEFGEGPLDRDQDRDEEEAGGE